jgi:hypothetical protein
MSMDWGFLAAQHIRHPPSPAHCSKTNVGNPSVLLAGSSEKCLEAGGCLHLQVLVPGGGRGPEAARVDTAGPVPRTGDRHTTEAVQQRGRPA